VVGHGLFSRGWLDAPRQLVEIAVLSPLGVLPSWQRRGVGSALVREGLARCAAAGVPAVFLEGSPDYYGRLGFEPAVELGFGKPSPRIPDAGFQVARLPRHEPWMTGTVVYADAFWRHDLVGLRD
jgi:putative acetyltransferase